MNFEAIAPGVYPELVYPPYKSTVKRGPAQPPLRVDAPRPVTDNIVATRRLLLPHDMDLTAHGEGAPLGEKIVVTGRVTDEDGKPVRNSLLEVWQCNAAGRYRHKKRPAPCAAGSQLPWLGQDADGRRWPLPLCHHQARPLPVGQP